ncbi:hypothetical protein BV22DRAFT_1123670 [Leucogyrophana mollusca]|uniref:Uncharacterized protein n=1 Tax=Leucogyrophana mollusca TaxID=85980 RepID=A0ACB8B1N4_9AGAM|nr:hypothetical protein BV22DRAFT_1123670 [Leucogyrophana mollusca]
MHASSSAILLRMWRGSNEEGWTSREHDHDDSRELQADTEEEFVLRYNNCLDEFSATVGAYANASIAAGDRVAQHVVNLSFQMGHTIMDSASWVLRPRPPKKRLKAIQFHNFSYNPYAGEFSNANELSIGQRGFLTIIPNEVKAFLRQPEQLYITQAIGLDHSYFGRTILLLEHRIKRAQISELRGYTGRMPRIHHKTYRTHQGDRHYSKHDEYQILYSEVLHSEFGVAGPSSQSASSLLGQGGGLPATGSIRVGVWWIRHAAGGAYVECGFLEDQMSWFGQLVWRLLRQLQELSKLTFATEGFVGIPLGSMGWASWVLHRMLTCGKRQEASEGAVAL